MKTTRQKFNRHNDGRKLVIQHTSGSAREQHAKTWMLYHEVDAGWRHFWSTRGGVPHVYRFAV